MYNVGSQSCLVKNSPFNATWRWPRLFSKSIWLSMVYFVTLGSLPSVRKRSYESHTLNSKRVSSSLWDLCTEARWGALGWDRVRSILDCVGAVFTYKYKFHSIPKTIPLLGRSRSISPRLKKTSPTNILQRCQMTSKRGKIYLLHLAPWTLTRPTISSNPWPIHLPVQ